MKKALITLVITAITGAALAQETNAPATLTFGQELWSNRGDAAAAMAMLPDAETQDQTNMVYYCAFTWTPKNLKADFVNSIPGGTVTDPMLTWLQIGVSPKGAVRNALLFQYFSYSHTRDNRSHYFDPAAATTAECIQFYELVLKNVALNEHTQNRLEDIKSDLIKLKDL